MFCHEEIFKYAKEIFSTKLILYVCKISCYASNSSKNLNAAKSKFSLLTFDGSLMNKYLSSKTAQA